MNLNAQQPAALSILAATSQSVRVDTPGKEPSITNITIEEDCKLISHDFDGANATRRKKMLKSPEKAGKYMYDTESIYTFDFYQDLLDVNTYALNLGFFSSSLTKYTDGQPIQFMCKTLGGKYLWSFQIWHEDLLLTKLERKLSRRSKSLSTRALLRLSKMRKSVSKIGM